MIAAVIAMAALAAGGTAYGIKKQNDAAEVAADSAKSSAAADYMAVSDAADQTNKAAANEALKLKRMALIERGRIMAAQSETGFIGNSPLREMLNARLKEREALGTTRFNQETALVQNSRESGKIFADATGRVNQARASVTGGWAAGLMIASSGVEGGAQGYNMYKGMTKPKKGAIG